MEVFIALRGVAHIEKFWKTTPREIYALADIVTGSTKTQTHRKLMELGEGLI